MRAYAVIRTNSDTEVILHLFARSDQKEVEDALLDALRPLEGAFTLLFLTKDALYGVRDPRGFRPLVLGKLGDSYVLCSETCALDLIDATYVREIEPGEL
ncbi:MAG: amidophosphoribosyltransferase, partial [Vicinamibacteria bacterium]